MSEVDLLKVGTFLLGGSSYSVAYDSFLFLSLTVF